MLISTIAGFCYLRCTIIDWYKSNPSDGKRAARKIKVGMPVDEKLHQNGEECGYPVPEADREVREMPTQIHELLSVEG